jgi:hypothetical protein
MKSQKWFMVSMAVVAVLVAALLVAPAALAQSPQNAQGPGYGQGAGAGNEFGPRYGRGSGPMVGLGPRLGGPTTSLVAVAAEQLGLSRTELVSELQADKTIAQVAEGQGVALDTIVAAFLAPRSERLAAMVEAERLSQEQADQMLATMEAEVLEHVSQPWTAQGPGYDGDGDGICDYDGAGPFFGRQYGGGGGRWGQ